MMNKIIKKVVVFLICFFSVFCFYGCWDSIELDKLFIVSAFAIDRAENPDEFEISIQIAKPTKPSSSSSGGISSGSTAQSKPTVILKTTAKNITDAISRINYDISRSLFLQHNHLLLINKDVAKEGVDRFVDYYMRDGKARLETSVLITNDKAEDVLKVETSQEQTSFKYIQGMLNDFERISPKSKTRMFDFAKKLIEPTSSMYLPIIKLYDTPDNSKYIKFEGVGVFKQDKMVDEFDFKLTRGVVVGIGDLNDGTIEVVADDGNGVLYVDKITNKKKVSLSTDNHL